MKPLLRQGRVGFLISISMVVSSLCGCSPDDEAPRPAPAEQATAPQQVDNTSDGPPDQGPSGREDQPDATTQEAAPGPGEADLLPLRLGMTREEVERLFPESGRRDGMFTLKLVHPAAMIPGGEIILPNGVSVSYALEGERICYLSTRSPLVTLDEGLSVGTSSKRVLEVAGVDQALLLPGYGHYVKVSRRASVWFKPIYHGEMTETEPVAWIEFRAQDWRYALSDYHTRGGG